ncbi:ErfK/YbiS/YcfS/YnhG family protein [Thalassoporum mexicanum PCC 7367]|uniref:L,D-transpeptidase n=1 Tax=Thalassoporum mexicanum TaxID=3457544 RepID=UPI00029F98A2|nr:L,D-transpeptidase [Pseudanabaena sp. PCC 7367]AFY69547.1 ErfK/YbiS/YcfS/YnhG family protein [Pseudanabaena sp. PCC 7367]
MNSKFLRGLSIAASAFALSGFGVGRSPVFAEAINSFATASNQIEQSHHSINSINIDSFAPELAPLNPTALLEETSREISLVLKLSDRRVYVYEGDVLTTSFPVAVGKPGWETPVGEFTVLNKETDPIFMDPFSGRLMQPGPNNPLGARAIDFWTDGRNFSAFHGTPHEHLIGQAVSHGCVRMLNADVIKLYEMVKVGTKVTVKP